MADAVAPVPETGPPGHCSRIVFMDCPSELRAVLPSPKAVQDGFLTSRLYRLEFDLLGDIESHFFKFSWVGSFRLNL